MFDSFAPMAVIQHVVAAPPKRTLAPDGVYDHSGPEADILAAVAPMRAHQFKCHSAINIRAFAMADRIDR
jgi:hypothetical protein